MTISWKWPMKQTALTRICYFMSEQVALQLPKKKIHLKLKDKLKDGNQR